MPPVTTNTSSDHNKGPACHEEKQGLPASSAPHESERRELPVDKGLLPTPSLHTCSDSIAPGSMHSNIGNQIHRTLSGDKVLSKEQSCDTSSQPQKLTGWAAVEKTFNDYDKQEIEGYKEDIDSLLTFTGLYSGVLTAFVIVSFTQLQQDTAGETLKVLRFIANQTTENAISGGQPVIQAPSTFSDSPPFQPSITAIRVNILWFASLVISLSTASFAILVKQWLRAYMAYTSSSPQGQMRIRYLRRSGLDAWRVLGIASILPLLLQVSLALFFVGLCFFTSDIHPAIGNTTIPLVSAWAFLFIAVTLSPICSTRCPFKTPALAPITTALRTRIYVPFIMPWVHPGRLAFALLYVVCFAIALPTIGPLTALWHFVDMAFPAANISHQKWTDILRKILRPTLHSLHAGLHRYEPRICREETEVSRDRSMDLMILASADTIQDNPELDSSLIEATLDQIQPHCSEALELLVNIIGNRIPLAADFEEGPEGVEIDMNLLSKNTQEAIQRIFSRHVTSALVGGSGTSGGQTTDHWKAGAWAISIFFSIHGYGPWDSDPPEPISWTYIHRWLCAQCQPQADHANGPQLLLWVCSYISRVRHRYTTKGDLKQDMDILQHAITVSANRATELCCGQPADSVLGPLAVRTARRLMESADSLRSPDRDWTYDAVLLALKLCGVVHAAGYSIDCADLLGVHLKDVVSRRTRAHMPHEDMVATWISLPPGYVEHYIADLLCEYQYDGDDYISITGAISATAKDAIVKDTTASQLLNLSLIALSLERVHAGKWINPLPPTGEPPDQLQMFHFIASALAKKRPRNIYRRNSIHLCDEEVGVAKMCWRRVAAMLRFDDDADSVAATLTSNANSRTDSPVPEDFDITRLPYMSYFLVELLTHFITEEELLSGGHDDKTLWYKVNMLSTEQRERIRKEGERAIGHGGGEASKSAGLRIFQSIQHGIFHSRRPDYAV